MSGPSRLRDTSKHNCIFVVTKNSQKSPCHTREVVKHESLHADYAVSAIL